MFINHPCAATFPKAQKETEDTANTIETEQGRHLGGAYMYIYIYIHARWLTFLGRRGPHGSFPARHPPFALPGTQALVKLGRSAGGPLDGYVFLEEVLCGLKGIFGVFLI